MSQVRLAQAGAVVLGSFAALNFGSLSGVTELTRNALNAGITHLKPAVRLFHKRNHFNYPNCNDDQVKYIRDAVSTAQDYASNSAALIAGLSAGVGLRNDYYEEWFGEWEEGRWLLVRERFEWMNAKVFSSFKYDCDCPDNADGSSYGLTYPDLTGTIYLCNNFWGADLVGTNSQAGTLIHEATHWLAVANGTKDITGSSNPWHAWNLAKNDPGAALLNAEQYEYFASHLEDNVSWREKHQNTTI